MSRRNFLPPPPDGTDLPLHRWLIEVQRLLGSEAVRTPNLAPGWSVYGNGFNPAGYWRDRSTVYLRGRLIGSAPNSIIFTLPDGFRPRYSQLFSVAAFNNPGRVEVRPNGTVFAANNDNTWLSLDGLFFKTGA